MNVLEKGKGMLFIVLLFLSMLAGCGKVETVTEKTVSSNSSEEVIEENIMDEAQKLRNEGNFDSAEEKYQNAYESTGNVDALIAVIEMWISEANDEKVKKWVDYAKANCEEPSDELSAIIDRGEKLKWMIRNIVAQNQDNWWLTPDTDNFYADYDESGRIIRTNIAFHEGTLEPFESGNDSNFTYEYKEDGSLKVTEHNTGETPELYEYTYDEEGRILITHYFREGEEVPSHSDYYQYGISYENDGFTAAAIQADTIDGEVPLDSEYRKSSVKYSGDKIDMFGLKSEYYALNQHPLWYTKDDYGNIVQCVAYFEGGGRSELDYQLGLEYVYCTPEEYLRAKESGDFSQYKTSGFNMDDVNVEETTE